MKTVPLDVRVCLIIWILIMSTSTSLSIGRAMSCRLEDHIEEYRMNNKPYDIRMNKCVGLSPNFIRSEIVNASFEPGFVAVQYCCSVTDSSSQSVFFDNIEVRYKKIKSCKCEKCHVR